ncbi:MAG: histone deacetylase family protein [Acidimicrobiia bacterium]|nr:histone deacetylase family protein [Acidimicrobiia bacterium]
MKVFSSPRHRLHDPEQELESSGWQPPFEHPGRAEAIHAALAADADFAIAEPAEWGTAPIEAVHDPGLVRFLASAWEDYQRDVRQVHDVVPDVFAMAGLRAGMADGAEPTSVAGRLGWWCFETTTPLTSGTYDAARSAVSVALSTAEAVLGGERVAYGLCRPPGHHATTALYGGYCFFNNAAVAAAHIAVTTGSKVAVLDVDYHHGNGTQQIFFSRGDVAFVSLHGDPARAYPYHTGFADETGAGRGRGSTCNVPLAAGTDDDAYLRALAGALDAVDAFDPAVVVVSLGVDTYVGDPMCDLAVTTDGFDRCGDAVAARGRPLVVLQEGGYADEALGANVTTWLRGAAGAAQLLPWSRR